MQRGPNFGFSTKFQKTSQLPGVKRERSDLFAMKKRSLHQVAEDKWPRRRSYGTVCVLEHERKERGAICVEFMLMLI